MNSLEFIDLLIKSREEEVNRYTKVKNNLYFNESKAYYEKEMIGKINEQIQHLQQIKTILEAWEVVKKHLEYFPDDYWNGIPEEIITMTSKIDKKDYPIIKKALEVTNETRK